MHMKKIINFTPTGNQPTRVNSLAPLLPNEIIEEVHEAYELGITLTHIHARNEDNTYKKEVYAEIIRGIKKHCPDLSVCVSLSGRLFSDFDHRSEVLEIAPDMGSLTMSSINFPKSSAVNEPKTIVKLIEKMDLFGVVPEIECFDTGMINYTNYLMQKGILKPPYYINVILGNLFNGQATLSTLADIYHSKPQDSIMCLGGIGKEQLPMNIIGLLYFDGIRIGLEDNLYYRDKEKTTNVELLKRVKRISDEINVEFMQPKEFQQLGFQNNKQW